MPIDATHEQYAMSAGRWQRMRDANAGSDAMHGAGERYIPRLESQTNPQYDAYNGRAGWLGATGRTLDSLLGLILRKPPQVKAPAAMADILADVDLAGRNLEDIAADIERELLAVARVAIVVDFPAADATYVSAAQAKAAGLRPIISTYTAEEVINWREARVNGRLQLILLVLKEMITEDVDPYTARNVEQIRALRLVDGIYIQEIFRRGEDKKWVQQSHGSEQLPHITPLANGKPLTYIPAEIVTSSGIRARVCEPPLLDLCDLNISHFRTSADLEHGAHYTGLPTPVISGYTPVDPNEKLSIGSTNAWMLPDFNASASYLEFTGQGLGALEKLLDRKEAGMAVLGARLLAAPKSGVESAAALEIRTSGETSMLATISNIASRALTIALIWARDWAGISGDVSVEVNSDFALGSMDPQKLTALVAAWQSGGISYQTLHWNLAKGEITPPGVDAETELAQIGDAAPALALPAPTVKPDPAAVA